MQEKIKESELILPSLYIMEMNGGFTTTSELKTRLRVLLNPQGEDLVQLLGRKDDKFSQIVRNLRAHTTFERLGFAEYRGTARNSPVYILQAGIDYLNRNRPILMYLLSNDFDFKDIQRNLRDIIDNHLDDTIEPFDENLDIREGNQRIGERRYYERSKKLRDAAIQQYSVNGRISCNCCSFNFNDFYGSEISRGYIEIHHIKPIYQFSQDNTDHTIRTALTNLIPVCSNCHKIIHRDSRNPLEIQVIKNSVVTYGVYNRQ